MTEETSGFEQARVRLEEIAAQVRKKDVSLEKSLDLLEEGVRLANMCTEQIDQTQWRAVVEEAAADGGAADAATTASEEPDGTSGEPDGRPEGTDDGKGADETGEPTAGAGALDTDDDVPNEDPPEAGEDAPLEDPDVEA